MSVFNIRGVQIIVTVFNSYALRAVYEWAFSLRLLNRFSSFLRKLLFSFILIFFFCPDTFNGSLFSVKRKSSGGRTTVYARPDGTNSRCEKKNRTIYQSTSNTIVGNTRQKKKTPHCCLEKNDFFPAERNPNIVSNNNLHRCNRLEWVW